MMTQSKTGCRQSNELFIMNHQLYNKYLEKQTINNQIINLDKNQKIIEINDIELKDYQIRENMTKKEIEQEKYVNKINQEIDDVLIKKLL